MAEVSIFLQFALGLVFAFSAASKLLDPVGFSRGVAEYRILWRPLAYPVGLVIVGIEGCLAAAHFTGWLLTTAVPVGVLMLSSFLIAVGVNLRHGRVLPCHCFGSRGGETISRRTIGRLLLLLISEVFLLVESQLFGVSHNVFLWISTLPELLLALLSATLLLAGGSWLLNVSDLIVLHRPYEALAAQAAMTFPQSHNRYQAAEDIFSEVEEASMMEHGSVTRD